MANQNSNGSWTGYVYWTGTLATAFYLPILGGTEIPTPPVPPVTTPEPGTLALMLAGLTGAGALARRRARKS